MQEQQQKSQISSLFHFIDNFFFHNRSKILQKDGKLDHIHCPLVSTITSEILEITQFNPQNYHLQWTKWKGRCFMNATEFPAEFPALCPQTNSHLRSWTLSPVNKALLKPCCSPKNSIHPLISKAHPCQVSAWPTPNKRPTDNNLKVHLL